MFFLLACANLPVKIQTNNLSTKIMQKTGINVLSMGISIENVKNSVLPGKRVEMFYRLIGQ